MYFSLFTLKKSNYNYSYQEYFDQNNRFLIVICLISSKNYILEKLQLNDTLVGITDKINLKQFWWCFATYFKSSILSKIHKITRRGLAFLCDFSHIWKAGTQLISSLQNTMKLNSLIYSDVLFHDAKLIFNCIKYANWYYFIT